MEQNQSPGSRATLLAPFAMIASTLPSGIAQTDSLATKTIYLPSRPGSLGGLGESSDPQLNTGSCAFRPLFALPPVRGRVQKKAGVIYHCNNIIKH